MRRQDPSGPDLCVWSAPGHQDRQVLKVVISIRSRDVHRAILTKREGVCSALSLLLQQVWAWKQIQTPSALLTAPPHQQISASNIRTCSPYFVNTKQWNSTGFCSELIVLKYNLATTELHLATLFSNEITVVVVSSTISKPSCVHWIL